MGVEGSGRRDVETGIQKGWAQKSLKKKKKREGNQRSTPKNLYGFKIHESYIHKGRADSIHIQPWTAGFGSPNTTM